MFTNSQVSVVEEDGLTFFLLPGQSTEVRGAAYVPKGKTQGFTKNEISSIVTELQPKLRDLFASDNITDLLKHVNSHEKLLSKVRS